MKYVVAGIALLIGMASAGYCQNRMPTSESGPVHPGTALLDAMGIPAGAPEATDKGDTQPKLSSASGIASPDSNSRKQE